MRGSDVTIHYTGIINNCKKRGFYPASCKSLIDLSTPRPIDAKLITYTQDLKAAVELAVFDRVALAEVHVVRVVSVVLRRRPEPAGSR